MGLGEAPSDTLAGIINDHITPRVIGCDLIDIAEIESRVSPPWHVVSNTDDNSLLRAFGGFEIALWDIRGKAVELPFYKLLGGAHRKQLGFSEYFAFRAELDGRGGESTVEQVLSIVNACMTNSVRRHSRTRSAMQTRAYRFV